MLSEGDSRHSQPEKTRWNWFCGLRTSTCTNAPVRGSGSQAGVVSQVWTRTITLSTRAASPGLSLRSRDRPLRLLSRPSTATRSATGVVPGGSWSADGRTGSALGCSWSAASLVSPPPQPANASAAAKAAARAAQVERDRRIVTQSGVHA
jgi:hypothetical protein